MENDEKVIKRLFEKYGNPDNKRTKQIAVIAIGLAIISSCMTVAFGFMLYNLSGDMDDNLFYVVDFQNEHVSVTVADGERIGRLEDEVFKAELPPVMINHDVLEKYDLRYLIIEENSTGELIVYNQFSVDDKVGEWDKLNKFHVTENENGTLIIEKIA